MILDGISGKSSQPNEFWFHRTAAVTMFIKSIAIVDAQTAEHICIADSAKMFI